MTSVNRLTQASRTCPGQAADDGREMTSYNSPIKDRSSHRSAVNRAPAELLCFIAAVLLPCTIRGAEDIYEDRVREDFIEHTTFRFRTKFNRTYNEDEEFKTIVSRRTDVPPLLDGVMEDECWKTADHSKTAFVQWLTREPNRKQTVIYVCHDDQNLYMAVVCEEPQPKTVRMLSHHPGGRRSWTTAGSGDCVETFIELGGVGGVGRVFQFIYNIYPEVKYDGLYPPYIPFIETGYKLGGNIGDKRWIVELAFPYKGFTTRNTPDAAAQGVDYVYEPPPRRGEVWGLRVVRDGPRPEHGEDQMMSTWTFNPTRSWHIPYPTGIIVFEDRNCLQNGKLNELDPKTGRPVAWKLTKVGDHVEGDLTFDEKLGQAILTGKIRQPTDAIHLTQTIGVLPGVSYKLSARVKKLDGDGEVSIGIDRPFTRTEFKKLGEWEHQELDFFSEPVGREATVFVNLIGGPASVAIDEIRVEQQIYGAPGGAKCLTGNSPREDLNVDKKDLALVKYTYREPGTDKEEFPYRKEWSPGWIHGMPDEGGTTGWISALKGSLTSSTGLKMIQWSHPRPTAGWVPYPKGHEIIFDLGKEYYVRTVELLPASAITNMTVSVRPEAAAEYILTSKLTGEGVLNPTGAVLYGRIGKIDSVCRYVKIWMGDGGHGVYFVRIWGEEKGEHKGVNRFRWKEGIVVPEEKYSQFRKLQGPVLMPTPQEVTWGTGEFIVKDGLPVYYRRDGKGEKVMRALVDEVYATFGIQLRPVLETGSETTASGNGAIVLGEPFANGLAAKMAKERGCTIDAKKPGEQGYFLSASPDGILICGYDQAGTFYGVQTLLQLLVRRDFSTAAAKSVVIWDWPYIPWRILDCRGGLTLPFMRALARLKVNVIMGSNHPLLDDYFMTTLPPWASHSGGSPIEMDDDENWYYLGCGPAGYMRINACPSHYQRYEFYDSVAKAAAADTGIGEINLNLDEMDGSAGGSRWNADRCCRVRNMTGDELFVEMILRAYDLNRLQNRKTACLDTMMVANFEGGNGDYHDMYKAYDWIPEDMHIFCWKGIPGDPSNDPEEAIRRFERATMLQSSFPLQGRGKLNEFYKAPPGKRVWGVWNTVWGVAGPVDEVLTGQFCRSMTMVDGGSCIPFMCQAWNPDSPPVHTEEWALKIGHLQQRFAELALERELPSWRDGVHKEFFKVDMRKACNWSHIDPVPGDGKDWLDWGPNNDLSRMPKGDVQFEEVPFTIIDPATNGGKSIVMVAPQIENPRLTLPSVSAEIPIGRKAASLIFLRGNIYTGNLPGYRITYEGGRYLTVPLDAMGNLSNGYSCYGLFPPTKTSQAGDAPNAFFRSARHQMTEYYSLFFRLGWMGTTGAGDPVKITIHEWVNPYPELTIQSVSIRCPYGRQSDRIEALLAITGVAPTPRDLALWKDRQRYPLVAPNTVEIEPTDKPLMPPKGKWAEEEQKGEGELVLKGPRKTYLDADGNVLCEVTGFPQPDGAPRSMFDCTDTTWIPSGVTLRLAHPQVCRKLAVRGQFYWEYFGPKVHYGVTEFRRLDYVIEASPDGNTWTQVAAKEGVCGEDGEHIHQLPPIPIQYVRVKLNSSRYANPRGYMAADGLTWLQLYK